MGMGGNENSTCSHFQSAEEKQRVSGATSASLGTSADSDTLDCHSPPAKNAVSSTLRSPTAQTMINIKAAMNWE